MGINPNTSDVISIVNVVVCESRRETQEDKWVLHRGEAGTGIVEEIDDAIY